MNITNFDVVNSPLTQGGIVAFLIWGLIKLFNTFVEGQVKKQNAEQGIDDRAVKNIDVILDILKNEREEKARLGDELSKANERFATFVTESLTRQMAAIDGVRKEGQDATRTLHTRLDESQRAVTELSKSHSECETRVRTLMEQMTRTPAATPTIINNAAPAAAPTAVTA